jgi:triacylglycerol lipase
MILLLLLIAIPLGISLLTFSLFWYEAANSPHGQYLEDLSNGSPGRLLIKGIISSYLSLVVTMALYPASFWRKWWEPRLDPDCPAPPVILVHGLYHNVSAWTIYRRWLAAAGFSNIVLLGYSSWNQSFHALVKRLEQMIAQVEERFPDKPPILIGHSLGGLLARACVQSQKGPSHVGGVITLGTPHQGSKMAALGLGKLAKSIRYRGPLIQELESGAEKADVTCVALYSPIDNMVLPSPALQTTCPGWIHQEVAPISHVAMLFHKPTAKLTIEYLKSMCNVVQ